MVGARRVLRNLATHWTAVILACGWDWGFGGLGVWGLGFGGFGFGVWGSRFGVWGLECGAWSQGLGVRGLRDLGGACPPRARTNPNETIIDYKTSMFTD